MFGIGMSEMLVILGVALLVFGPEKLPEIAKGVAKGLRDLRRASDDLQRDLNLSLDDPQPKPRAVPRPTPAVAASGPSALPDPAAPAVGVDPSAPHDPDHDELHAHIQGSELLRNMQTHAGTPGAPADAGDDLRVHARDDVVARGATSLSASPPAGSVSHPAGSVSHLAGSTPSAAAADDAKDG